MSHALVTGPIEGEIPIDHPNHPAGVVDVTPSVLILEDDDHALALADAIEQAHLERGTHPEPNAARERQAAGGHRALGVAQGGE